MASYNPFGPGFTPANYGNITGGTGGGYGSSGYGGGGPFGTKVAPIPMPNPAQDLASQFPGLAGTNAALSTDINAQLGGKLSPGTLAAMQDYEASMSAGSGMPGSNAIPGTLGYNRGVRDLGLTAEGQVKAGEAAYNSTIPTISRTQTVDPALQANINEENAINLSAPDPAAAQSYAQQLFDKYMNALRGPGGGTRGGSSGGTGGYASVKSGPSLSGGRPTNSFETGYQLNPANGGGVLNAQGYYGPLGYDGAPPPGMTPQQYNQWMMGISDPSQGSAPDGNPQSMDLSNDSMFGGMWDAGQGLDELGF